MHSFAFAVLVGEVGVVKRNKTEAIEMPSESYKPVNENHSIDLTGKLYS
jgi:hypothetical protein